MERQSLDAEAETRTRCRVRHGCRRCIRDRGCERPILHIWSGLNIPHNNWRNFNDGCRDEHGWRTLQEDALRSRTPQQFEPVPLLRLDGDVDDLRGVSTSLNLNCSSAPPVCDWSTCVASANAFISSAKPFTRASCSEATWTQLLLLAACDATEADKLFSASTRSVFSASTTP